jgi:YHS domain-containing protein
MDRGETDRRVAAGGDLTNRTQEVNKMAMDPVCKMEVEPKKAPAKAEYKGETYYFCAPGCKAAFEKNPEKFLKEEEESK